MAGIEKEDDYISFSGHNITRTDEETNYEYHVSRSKIVRTAKYKISGSITASNPKLRLYNVSDRVVFENILTKKEADLKVKSVISEFQEKILEYAGIKE